jgi:hypothetical protein
MFSVQIDSPAHLSLHIPKRRVRMGNAGPSLPKKWWQVVRCEVPFSPDGRKHIPVGAVKRFPSSRADLPYPQQTSQVCRWHF